MLNRRVLGVAGVVAASTVFAAPPSLNLESSLRDTKQILSAGGQADIVVMGDSLSFRPGSYLPVFRNLLQQRYGNAGGGYQGSSLWTGATFNSGWQVGQINQDTAPNHSLDGLWSTFDGAAAYPNQAYVTPSDSTVQIQYMTQPGGGSFEIRYGRDRGVAETLSTDGPAGQVRTVNYTLGWQLPDYTIQPRGDGPVTILGQNNIRTTPGVRVHRAANGGWGVDNFLGRDTTFDQQLGSLSTDLVFIWLGQNDQDYTRSTYAARMSQLVDRVQAASPNAEIVLVGTYDQGAAPLAELVEGVAGLAEARGLGFINLYSTAGNSAFFQSNGFLDDPVHFSPAGGEYVGRLMFNAFETNGASLIPEPAILGLLAAGALLLRRR